MFYLCSMRRGIARRQFLTAIAGSVAVAACANAAKAAPETMRYEALLAARWDEKSNLLLMTIF
jgi:hypothetical protein